MSGKAVKSIVRAGVPVVAVAGAIAVWVLPAVPAAAFYLPMPWRIAAAVVAFVAVVLSIGDGPQPRSFSVYMGICLGLYFWSNFHKPLSPPWMLIMVVTVVSFCLAFTVYKPSKWY